MSGSTAHAHSAQPWPRMTQDMLMYGQALPKTPALPQSHDQYAFPQTHYTNAAQMSHQTQQDMDNNNTRPPMETKKVNMSQRNGHQGATRRPPIQQKTVSRSIANHVLLAPIIRNKRHQTVNCDLPGVVIDPLADRSNNSVNGSPKTRIAIATDCVLGPAKKHIAKVFLKHGVTGSFSPNLEKLVEITGDMTTLFHTYKAYCTKRHLKTVNRETYARLFRNEFKRKVGAR